MDAHPFDRAACLASAHVAAVLDDLHATRETPHPGTAHGWSVVVIVTPAASGDGLDCLTQCDRDCLALLAQAQGCPSDHRGVFLYRFHALK